MSEVPENIAAFNRVTLALFARLYDSFPKPINIDPDASLDIGFSAVSESNGEQESWNIGTMGNDVIEWLAEESFLRYDPDPNHRYGYYWRARLTLKGLTILGYVPTSVQPSDEKEALITKIKRALVSGSTAASAESIKYVISEIFKIALARSTAILQ